MTYRITQAHDGWRASFEGHGLKIIIPPMKKEEEAITNLNRMLVYHGLSRMQLPVKAADACITIAPLDRERLKSQSEIAQAFVRLENARLRGDATIKMSSLGAPFSSGWSAFDIRGLSTGRSGL